MVDEKMDILETLEEDVTYEVLVLSGEGKYTNIKPFGVKYVNNSFVLNLFPNKTLHNIKKNNKFVICFTQDILLFTQSLDAKVNVKELISSVNYCVYCSVVSMNSNISNDAYGKNIKTQIIAKTNKIIKHNETIPIINRATNHILEVLVDLSRYTYMDIDAKTNFNNKIKLTEKIIQKTGNNKHKKAIQTIKKIIKR